MVLTSSATPDEMLHYTEFHKVCQSTHLGVSVLKGKRLPNNKRAIIVAANHIKIYQEIKKLYVFEVSIISLIMKQYFWWVYDVIKF